MEWFLFQPLESEEKPEAERERGGERRSFMIDRERLCTETCFDRMYTAKRITESSEDSECNTYTPHDDDGDRVRKRGRILGFFFHHRRA